MARVSRRAKRQVIFLFHRQRVKVRAQQHARAAVSQRRHDARRCLHAGDPHRRIFFLYFFAQNAAAARLNAHLVQALFDVRRRLRQLHPDFRDSVQESPVLYDLRLQRLCFFNYLIPHRMHLLLREAPSF